MTAYQWVRLTASVYYLAMCAWLILAGARRAYLMLVGLTPVDPAPITSVTIGVVGLVLLAIGALVRARTTRKKLRQSPR